MAIDWQFFKIEFVKLLARTREKSHEGIFFRTLWIYTGFPHSLVVWYHRLACYRIQSCGVIARARIDIRVHQLSVANVRNGNGDITRVGCKNGAKFLLWLQWWWQNVTPQQWELSLPHSGDKKFLKARQTPEALKKQSLRWVSHVKIAVFYASKFFFKIQH